MLAKRKADLQDRLGWQRGWGSRVLERLRRWARDWMGGAPAARLEGLALTPAARSLVTGHVPDASFMFDSGQCTTDA